MSDVIQYEINGKTYTQSFLTISETIDVADILQKVKFKNYQPIAILKALRDAGILEKLFNIILKGNELLTLDEIKPAIALKVIADFFSLNDILQLIATITSLMSELSESGALTALNEMTSPIGTS